MASNPSKRVCNNILEAIGHTPLVRLNSVTKGVPATVYAKVETFNPGNSIKDRMALKMVGGCRKGGHPEAGRNDHRGHIRKYRDGDLPSRLL